MMRQYRSWEYWPISPWKLRASDLRREAAAAAAQGDTVRAYRAEVSRPGGWGQGVEPEQLDIVHVVEARRIGIAWRADTDWLDASSIEKALDTYFAPGWR